MSRLPSLNKASPPTSCRTALRRTHVRAPARDLSHTT